MIHLPSFALGVASVALAAGVFTLVDLLRLHRRLRRLAARAELARHQALPPLPPEAWIRLRSVDVIRPLPARRRRPQNWRNN